MVDPIQLLYDHIESKGYLIEWDHEGLPEIPVIVTSVGERLRNDDKTITDKTVLFEVLSTEVIALTRGSRGWDTICDLKEPDAFEKIDRFLRSFQFRARYFNI